MADYLVTGGSGFVGSHLCDALLALGHEVTVLDNFFSGKRENLPDGVRLVRGDVTDLEVISQAIKGADGVFHLAGIASVSYCNEHWRDGHLTNQTGSVSVFEAAKRAGGIPVVYTSSAAVYGDSGAGPAREDRPVAPQTAYGIDKYGSELHGRIGHTVHGLPSVGLRPFNIYGPRQDPQSAYSGVISIFYNRLQQGLPITVFGDGLQTRDFVFVSDIVKFLVAAMARADGAAQVYNACTGRSVTLLGLIETLARLHGVTPEILHAAPRVGDIRHSLGDPSKARDGLGVSAEITLDDGLQRMLG